MKKVLILIFALVFLSGLALAANCPPSLPKIYYGTVNYNQTPLSGTFEIRAVIGNDNIGISDVVGGNYEIDVSPCSGITGTVSFYTNGIKSNEDGFYGGMDDWGKTENLDLTLNQMPGGLTCGDGIIQTGEECDGTNLAGRDPNSCGIDWTGTISCSSNCLIDYSSCAYSPPPATPTNNSPVSSPPSSGGPSGGSPGGSSTTSNTPTNDNIIQLNGGESSNSGGSDGENINLGLNDDGILGGTNLGITGAAIGFVKSGKGMGIITALLILGVGAVVIRKRMLVGVGKANK